ncbi:hypothetical protein M9978_15110 [Sphingomonas sp. MG17]|uniref:Acid phosphatase n=1 Tax=Sphingomonas tagetis TaxID=2949092 RepID=A0A9X2KLP6_9SPHN|nr:hypothetical protein [Sphingomonas tagetis]MCP3731754.1 hypothetical protein [Sphingomonas tagetis]
MIRLRAALVLASAAVLTGGCVAAAIPVMAGGVIARDKLRDREAVRRQADAAKREAVPATLKTQAAQDAVRDVGTAALPSADRIVPTTLTELPRPDSAAGEDAAASLQAYQALWIYLSAQAAKRRRGEPLRSVVLEPGSTLDAPRYVPCESKPLAILFDLDENPAKSADADARWRRWKGDGSDPLVAVPGAVDGVAAARREGIAVIFTSARMPEGASGVAAAVARLGLGEVEPGKTLQLRGGLPGDGVRQTIAASYCVVAMVGDALGDFSDLFPPADASGRQPAAVTETMVAPLWGAGWFLLPNPVRSTAAISTASNGEK